MIPTKFDTQLALAAIEESISDVLTSSAEHRLQLLSVKHTMKVELKSKAESQALLTKEAFYDSSLKDLEMKIYECDLELTNLLNSRLLLKRVMSSDVPESTWMPETAVLKEIHDRVKRYNSPQAEARLHSLMEPSDTPDVLVTAEVTMIRQLHNLWK